MADALETIRSTWSDLAGCAGAFADPGVRMSVADHSVAPVGWIGAVSLGDAAVIAVRPADAHAIEHVMVSQLSLSDIHDRTAAEAVFGPIDKTLGPAILAFELSNHQRDMRDDATVGPISSSDPMAQAVIEASSPAEVEESAIEDLASGLFVAQDNNGRPVAASGYAPVRDKLAHIGVLTVADARGRGFGGLAATRAMAHARAAGLISQWRAAESNTASLALASRLGLTPVGRQFSFRPARVG